MLQSRDMDLVRWAANLLDAGGRTQSQLKKASSQSRGLSCRLPEQDAV